MSTDTLVILFVQVATFAVSYGTLLQRVKTIEANVEELQVFTGLKSKKAGAGK